jgi:hypothetical protein
MTRVTAAQTWTAATGAQAAANETFGDDAALQALEDHKKQMNAAILQLDIEPPRRLALAKQQLDKALANELYDHTTIRLKRHHPSTPNRSRRSIIDTPDVALPTWPLLEVYAAGGLNSDTRWYVSNDGRSASEWISLNAAGNCKAVLSIPDIQADAFHGSRATAPCPRSGPCSSSSSTTI